MKSDESLIYANESKLERINNERIKKEGGLNVKKLDECIKKTHKPAELDIKIKYFSDDYPRLKKISKGDWIDLRVNTVCNWKDNDNEQWKQVKYSKGDVIKFGLGVAMKLPHGYESHVVPRSSTFKHWGLILTNSFGVIDNSYSGNNDEWMAEFIATRDGVINRFDRVCQFRIQKNQPYINLTEVDKLDDKSRGGYGTTGRK